MYFKKKNEREKSIESFYVPCLLPTFLSLQMIKFNFLYLRGKFSPAKCEIKKLPQLGFNESEDKIHDKNPCSAYICE